MLMTIRSRAMVALAAGAIASAFATAAAFGRALILVTVGIIVVICVASMVIAQVMMRPIRRLEAGTQKISSGDYDVHIPVRSMLKAPGPRPCP